MIDRSKLSSGAIAQQARQAARDKLLQAEHIRAGAGAYNLACVEALEGDSQAAVRWLNLLLSSGDRLTKKRIRDETDFERIRDDPSFRAFLESLPDE